MDVVAAEPIDRGDQFNERARGPSLLHASSDRGGGFDRHHDRGGYGEAEPEEALQPARLRAVTRRVQIRPLSREGDNRVRKTAAHPDKSAPLPPLESAF